MFNPKRSYLDISGQAILLTSKSRLDDDLAKLIVQRKIDLAQRVEGGMSQWQALLAWVTDAKPQSEFFRPPPFGACREGSEQPSALSVATFNLC